MRTRTVPAAIAAAALLAAVAAGCAASDSPGDAASSGTTGTSGADASTAEDAPTPDLSASPLPTASAAPKPSFTLPVPPPPSGGAESVPPDVLDAVRADAAKRLGVTTTAVEVLSGAGREWSDGSLGCPKPGENYLQVITEGYQVIVAANGQTLDYRTSTQGAIKVC